MKGKVFEQQSSKQIHQYALPVLISPLLLREKNLGQVDICILCKSKSIPVLKVIEIKSKSYPDKLQYKRLLGTVNYLSQILEIEVELKVRLCQKRIDSLFY